MRDEPREDGPPEANPGTPLWAKVFGGVALAVVLLVVILLLIGGGHGPGRHAAADAHAPTPSTGAMPAGLGA